LLLSEEAAAQLHALLLSSLVAVPPEPTYHHLGAKSRRTVAHASEVGRVGSVGGLVVNQNDSSSGLEDGAFESSSAFFIADFPPILLSGARFPWS